ncbi:MAG TPA: rhodanese-like domain-containing protein, partial [Chitinophagaceae bacterium]|nr:rhodanese-like domain-containing protein [Chitinophagaceae bacterium]
TEIENFNYDWHCGLNDTVTEIEFYEFEELRKNEEIKIIDVREEGEIPKVEAFSCINIPLSNFVNKIQNIELTNRVVVFCQHGKRSIKAAQILKAKYNHLNIVSLKGGIVEWEKQFNDSIY